MKTLTVLAALALLALAAPARAQQLDLATVTCKDFVASDKETISLIMMWLEGYYTEEPTSRSSTSTRCRRTARHSANFAARTLATA